jgi:glycosyltransferase involved in cell wall biosynthesis
MPATPAISLVIPTYNEERLLPRLLDTVEVAQTRYGGAVQLIVADNRSKDRTAAVAAARGCEVACVEERCIAAVRNGGARTARSEILCFVDADIRIHPQTFVAVDAALASGRVVAGATGVRLERWSPGIALTYALFMPLVWGLRMDTGLTFCRRRDFEAVGGYDEGRSFGEDVALLFAFRALGRQRGERLARLRQVKAIASMRKFDQHGDWHYFRLMPRLLPGLLRRTAGDHDFARRYWYGEQREP